jgi:hypothetical protein
MTEEKQNGRVAGFTPVMERRVTMTERLDDILGLIIFFSPCITAFVLVAFSPLKQLRQPGRLLVIGLANGANAGLISGLGMLRGMVTSRALLFIVGVSILIGAFFSLLASSESISEQKRDELVRKSDDQSWRV